MTRTRTMTAPVQDPPVARVDLSKAIVNVGGLRAAVRTGWKTLAAALPEHMAEERFLALLYAQASKDIGLFRCTGESILNACFQAASLGLEVNAATGEAFIVPFNDSQSGKTIATLVPGYKGLAKLAIQSPHVLGVNARLVYDGEPFKVYYGTRDEIVHEPNFDLVRIPENVIAAYAIAKMQGGAVMFEVMTRKQLNVIRDKALVKTRQKGPWKTDEEEMLRKTPFRRLAKYLPLTPQLAQAIELSDRYETGEIHAAKVRMSNATEALNHATAAALSDKCVKGCKVVDGKVVHDPECNLFADELESA